jgi:hypothetical protein
MAESAVASPSKCSKPTEITEPNLLVVEGRDEEEFFDALIRQQGISRIQVLSIGGKTKLRENLKALRDRTSSFANVLSIGFVRDADDNPEAAFQSVCDALQVVKLPVPPAPLTPAGHKPKVQILILPGGKNPGMLEDLCLQAVADHIQMDCVNDFFRCLENKNRPLSGSGSKAAIQVYLASLEPGIPLGVAAGKGFWPWDKPAFDSIKRFLGQVAG